MTPAVATLTAIPNNAAPMLPSLDASLIDAINNAVLDAVNTHVLPASMEATEKGFRYADGRARDMLDQMRKELSGYAKPQPLVLGVSTNGGPIAAVTPELTPARANMLARLIRLTKSGISPYLVGPRGTGKTTLAHQLAQSLKLEFGHLSCSAGASETWLMGRHTPNGLQESSFCKLYENGGLFLLDELDAADPNFLVALNVALENGRFYNPIVGREFIRHPDFILIAGGNTFGRGADSQYTGRNRLDASTLDRFWPVEIGYDLELEKKLCPDTVLLEKLWSARVKLNELKSEESISTRAIKNAYIALTSGDAMPEVLRAITAPWVSGIAEQCGLAE